MEILNGEHRGIERMLAYLDTLATQPMERESVTDWKKAPFGYSVCDQCWDCKEEHVLSPKLEKHGVRGMQAAFERC